MRIKVEYALPLHIAQALRAKGHDIKITLNSLEFGRAQIIQRDQKKGVLSGGTEPRTDGTIAAY